MSKQPKVSIIIPVYKVTPEFHQAIEKCLGLNYSNFEILVGVDSETKLDLNDKKIKLIRTGQKNTGPAEKRDIAILKSKAEYIAFLDDDSYPRKDWLDKANNILNEKKDIAAVGGPGLTPPENSFQQKITGGILSTYIGTGPYSYRFVQQPPRLVDDYPAYNLIARRKTLLKVGGFNNKFYGGEDTALCLKLINAGEKILYHPEVVVYHHRRTFPRGYLKQVGNVGMHRGYFVKRYPQTSLRLSYFMPSIGILGSLIVILFFIFTPGIRLILLFLTVGLYVIGLIDSLRSNSLLMSIILPFCVYLAHISYAINFIKGLVFTRNLKR